MKRYTAKDLSGMTLKSLADVGTDLGLVFTKNHSRAKRARMILDKYNELDLSDSPVGPPSQDSLLVMDPKPAFERLVDDATPDVEGDTPPPQRGGVRPGAGRPPGMTEELAAFDRLSKQPHPAIRGAIEKLFAKWAERVACPEVKLDEKRAVALALAWTHAYEISPVKGWLPLWSCVALECLWTTWAIVDEKATVARGRQRVESQIVTSVN